MSAATRSGHAPPERHALLLARNVVAKRSTLRMVPAPPAEAAYAAAAARAAALRTALSPIGGALTRLLEFTVAGATLSPSATAAVVGLLTRALTRWVRAASSVTARLQIER